MAKKTARMGQKLGFTGPKLDIYIGFFGINQPLGTISIKMFIPVIKYLGTDKQRDYWVPLA